MPFGAFCNFIIKELLHFSVVFSRLAGAARGRFPKKKKKNERPSIWALQISVFFVWTGLVQKKKKHKNEGPNWRGFHFSFFLGNRPLAWPGPGLAGLAWPWPGPGRALALALALALAWPWPGPGLALAWPWPGPGPGPGPGLALALACP